jgi:rRNA-processing protein FCF1
MKIILDTNFLIDSLRFGVDVVSELAGNELFVLDANISEIGRLADGNAKESPLARMAIKLIESKGIKVLKSKENETDDSLVSYSKEGYAIATHDRILKGRLKKSGSKIVLIRQKKYIVFE